MALFMQLSLDYPIRPNILQWAVFSDASIPPASLVYINIHKIRNENKDEFNKLNIVKAF